MPGTRDADVYLRAAADPAAAGTLGAFAGGGMRDSLGYTTSGYSDLLFPGLLALTAVITSMQTLQAIGVGLRYRLPIGPLRIDYGYNPNRRQYEDSGAFHLSFGFAF